MSTYPDKSNSDIAWMYMRLLGGLHYATAEGIKGAAWKEVAGYIIPSDQTASEYFNYLGLTEQEFTNLHSIINNQHSKSSKNEQLCDFAHFCISLSARLAYYSEKDGLITDIASLYMGEDISHSSSIRCSNNRFGEKIVVTLDLSASNISDNIKST